MNGSHIDSPNYIKLRLRIKNLRWKLKFVNPNASLRSTIRAMRNALAKSVEYTNEFGSASKHFKNGDGEMDIEVLSYIMKIFDLN